MFIVQRSDVDTLMKTEIKQQGILKKKTDWQLPVQRDNVINITLRQVF